MYNTSTNGFGKRRGPSPWMTTYCAFVLQSRRAYRRRDTGSERPTTSVISGRNCIKRSERHSDMGVLGSWDRLNGTFGIYQDLEDTFWIP
jgi:hypothetical protein